MANSAFFNVKENFDMKEMIDSLAEEYKRKGYTVRTAIGKNSTTVHFEKNASGIALFVGLGESVDAQFRMDGDSVAVDFSNQQWLYQILAIAAGCILCLVPTVTGIMGIIRQTSLPKEIANSAENLSK